MPESKKTGVMPVFKHKFKLGATAEAVKTVAEMETFSVAIDGKVEEWSPFEAEGWVNRMVTGKSIAISFKGKRCVGDAGNDYVANCALATGEGCDGAFEWEFPSGAKITMACVINVSNPGGGDSTGVDGLEFDVLSNGKPEFTPAT